MRQAEQGGEASRAVSAKLAEIVGNAQKVSDIVAEMAASAREQAAGIEQVNKAVGEMDKVTQQNAASSEESSSAAEELSSQSEELAGMVGSFRIQRANLRRAAQRAAAPVQKPKAASRNGANGHGTGNGIPLKPEELIPLEGEGFKDF